jgi:hypothetical protein
VVVEKDDTVLRYAKDGSSVRALSITEHILSDAGVRSSGIISIPFAALTQTVTFDSVRVRKHSGEVIETPAGDAQEVPMPVTQAAPMYSDLRMKQLPVKSLSVGDTVEYRLSMKDTNADAPGRLLVCDGLYIGHAGEGGDAGGARPACTLTFGEGQESAASGERRGRRAGYRWKHETASEYPKKQETDKTAPLNTVQAVYEPDVAMTSFHTWAELGAWIFQAEQAAAG